MAIVDTVCNVSTCQWHHSSNRCTAGEIEVQMYGDHACCNTFITRDENTQPVGGNASEVTHMRQGILADDSRGVNIGEASHIHEEYASNLSPMVTCSAQNCKYNEQGICYADSIVIDGATASTSPHTNCNMYVPRD